LQELAAQPSFEFLELARQYPQEFKQAFGQANAQTYAVALNEGRNIYVAEGCWHCHSQFIRPVGNEQSRYGPVSRAGEYENVLQKPQLLGTRRVGPDLFREGEKYSNDWHFAHFWDPPGVSPVSVMPRYRWFFGENKRPNRKGLAMVTYLQWLGSWNPMDTSGGTR
jgi:cbb3-type cytochrome c oxidase subunit II